ncbi:MAG: right-handed parallel beta-helix repeat-containing protein [Deltaproteobacteria bacterium]|jgi:hypothetical protein
MRASFVAGTALLLIACGGDGDSLAVPSEVDALATLVVTERPDSTVVVTAVEGGAVSQLLIPLDVEQTVWVLHYQRTLAELQIEPGFVPRAAPGEPSRPLPEFDLGRRAVVADGTSLGFEEVTELADGAAAFRIAAIGGLACADSGGCLVGDTCETPCTNTPPLYPDRVALPASTTPPIWAECPTGFVAYDAAGVQACAPPARVFCSDEEVQWIDAEACAPIVACPAGPWPDPLPANARWFVQAGATGGDGSMGAPFATLDAAVAAAADGDVVVVAQGDHAIADALATPLTIVGACPSGTTLTAGGTLDITAEVTLANLRLEAADVRTTAPLRLDAVIARAGEIYVATTAGLQTDRTRIIGRVDADGPIGLERTIVGGGTRFGVHVYATTGTLTDVVLEGVALHTNDEDGRGPGLRVRAGAVVTGERVFVTRTSAYGVQNDAASLELTDLVVRATRPRGDGEGGIGVYGTNSSTTTLDHAIVEDSLTIGVYVRNGAHVVLRDVVVHGTRARPMNDLDGEGLTVFSEASASGERVWLADNQHVGLLMRGTTVELSDLTVIDTLGRATDDKSGEGIIVEDGAFLTLIRADVARNRDTGIVAVRDSRIVAEDVVVRETMPSPDGRIGDGFRLTTGAFANVQRLQATDNHFAGVLLREDAMATMTDVTISGTKSPGPDSLAPKSLFVDEGSTARVDRIEVFDGEGHCIDVRDGANATLFSVDVQRCELVGLSVGNGSTVDVDRALFADSGPENVAVRVGAVVSLQNVRVEGARMAAGIVPTGVLVEPEARLRMEKFELVDNEGVGLLIRTLADADVSDGAIREHSTGILLGDPEYDVARVLERVAFSDNFANVTLP